MFTIKAKNNTLLGPLQFVTGIVERRHTLPILSNVLVEVNEHNVNFLATDLEVQIRASAKLDMAHKPGSLTVGAKKLQDILRALPHDADTTLETKESRLTVKAGKSRFALQTLAAADFPKIAEAKDEATEFSLPQKEFKRVLGLVQFAMAVQDIRYYLNGVLLSTESDILRVVATDGHRLSMASYKLPEPVAKIEAILPRKTALELIKLLDESDDPIQLRMHQNQVKFSFAGIEIVSKIVEGKFPDYTKVIPTGYSNHVTINRAEFLSALQRASILSNDKIRGVRLVFTKESLSIICSNNEQEEAEENLPIAYDKEAMDIAFNIAYLLDVLNHLTNENVMLSLGEANMSSALFTQPGGDEFKYVVMPMRI
ncbi:MAG: DNA polymerase III subunit beta [Betaproteobacteria bacterium]|nr:DNA polymerase III subunit beta [Betaproteobacteria bacterium]